MVSCDKCITVPVGNRRRSHPAICSGEQRSSSLSSTMAGSPASGPTSSASAGGPSPGGPIGREGSVAGAAAVTGDLPRHRRGRPAQPGGDRPQRQPGGQAAGDLLPLVQAEPQFPPPPRRRPHPATALEQVPDRRGMPAHRPGQHLHRLPDRHRRHTSSTSAGDNAVRTIGHHPIPSPEAKIMKCCDDPLRPPRGPNGGPGAPRVRTTGAAKELPGVSLHMTLRAEWHDPSQGPSMYEMEGPSPGLRHKGDPISQAHFSPLGPFTAPL